MAGVGARGPGVGENQIPQTDLQARSPLFQWVSTARIETIQLGLVSVAAALPFLNSLGNDFTFDDVGIIRDNPLLRNESPIPLLQSTYLNGAMYRPLTMLTYYANIQLDASPVGFHLVNVALHVVVTVLVFHLCRALLSSAWIATVAALLFAVHPIHTEAVTSIVGRGEILAAVFVLVTLLAFIEARRRPGLGGRGLAAVSLLSFTAGLLAKEGAFAALPLLAVVDVWLFRETTLRRRVALLFPYAAATAAVLALRYVVIGSLTSAEPPSFLDNPLVYVPWPARIQTATVILWDYLAQLALPWNLSADYSFNQIPIVASPFEPRFLAAAIPLLVLASVLAWASLRAPALFLAVLLMLVPLAITANVLYPIGTIKAERLLYLPSVGWCILLAYLAWYGVRVRPQAAMVVLAALVVGFGGRTWARNTVWADNLHLFQATVQASPSNAKAHHNLATALFEAGQLDDAMLHYRQALAILPSYDEAAFAVGRIYDVRGMEAGALHWYERALQLNWENVSAHLNTGAVRLRLGELASAEAAFLTGLRLEPDNPRLLNNLALVRTMQGSPWAANDLLEGVEQTDIDETDRIAVASLYVTRKTERP